MGLNSIGNPIHQPNPDVGRRQSSTDSEEDIEEESVALTLDHFGNGTIQGKQTFRNRFWVAESGYKPGGPVFIYDNGESDAETGAMFRLTGSTSFFKQLVDEFGGIGIVWEHRYYGRSLPVKIGLDTPPEAFKYLTTEQALADVKEFASSFSRPNFPDVDLTPKGTPWIFLGGSYPGMRAVFMRKFYPETIFASYASSAPVQASVVMNYYFDTVARGMRKYGWGNCTEDIHAAIRYMDRIMVDPAKSSTLKEDFLGRRAANNTNAAFADALTSIFALWQSYGVEGGPYSLRSFCNWISTDPATNQTAPARGWAATKGPQFTVDRWSKWANFKDVVNINLYTECEGVRNSSETTPDCDLNLPFPEPNYISWVWQYCSEWGFLQYANYGPNQLVSSWNDLKHQQDICNRQFPEGYKNGLLPEWPNMERANRHFGGWSTRPSNVYWTDGEFDPWRTLSPLSGEWFSPGFNSTQAIPKCGESTGEGGPVFGMVLKNAQHCYDLRIPSVPDSDVSRGHFTNALREWLKCWRPTPMEGVSDGQNSTKSPPGRETLIHLPPFRNHSGLGVSILSPRRGGA
ncbi:peptidase S28 [Eremomyces bilateralis CBS 781.70]|uniref:Peptidase S28 n=1 Tax=Eremomyces bilateralis CBS 781.70 TaxID=1392243 RepID=A0A6G1G652_9PEZI|nr:peptidase S28 [Eremomyces bilateralis CBS 781.70]KAF1813543.1 peptidase S28 [Eremomyces bilateralis CBS 781.70]